MPAPQSSWVNLQDYLALNEDQGNDMGQRLYGDAQTKAQKAKSQLEGDTSAYGTAVNEGTVQGPTGDGSRYTEQQAAANAQGQYSGPKDLASYDPTLEGNVTEGYKATQAVSDPNQRGSVIQETYGGQGASGIGGSALDNFLVGASPAGEQLAGLGKQYSGLLQSLGLAETDAYAKSQLGMAQSQQNAKQWADLATKKAADAAAAKEKGDQKQYSDAPDSSGRPGLSEKEEHNLQTWYDSLVQKVAKDYVGEGKEFSDMAHFKNWLGGVGQGFNESFGGGALGSKDSVLRNLAMLGRTAYGGFTGPAGAGKYASNYLYELEKSGGGIPATWAQDYKPPAGQDPEGPDYKKWLQAHGRK